MSLNVIQLLNKMSQIQDELNKVRQLATKHMFFAEIQSIATDFNFEREGLRLAEAIANRDFPLTRAEVKQCLETSGFDWIDSDIDVANPDSDSATSEYRREQAADYASVFGNERGSISLPLQWLLAAGLSTALYSAVSLMSCSPMLVWLVLQ